MYNATMLSWLEITPSAKRKHSNLPLSNVRFFGATTTMYVNPFCKYLRLLTPILNLQQQKKHTKDYFKGEDRLEKVLAAPFRKGKAYEDIIKEWQKLLNTNEVNAKYRYVQLCRSLKTYGKSLLFWFNLFSFRFLVLFFRSCFSLSFLTFILYQQVLLIIIASGR